MLQNRRFQVGSYARFANGTVRALCVGLAVFFLLGPYPANSVQNGQEFCATGVPPVKNIALAGRPMSPFFRAFAASREEEILLGSGSPRLGAGVSSRVTPLSGTQKR